MSARMFEKSRISPIPSQDVRQVFDADNQFALTIMTDPAQCYRIAIVEAARKLQHH